MKDKRILFVGALAFFSAATTALADDTHTFPAEGKTYVIHRFNNQNSYIYENGSVLNASPKTNTQKQYWQFVPTENANCYYIQNVTSKKYVQSSKTVGENGQIKVGATPVEFEVKINSTDGAAPKGYYYMCSTDQTISTAADGTLGLNFKEATGQVVAYSIRYNRGNSYWDIVESDYDYEPPAPIERSEYCKKLGVYVLPCGEKGSAYLKDLQITGDKDAVLHTLSYSATTQPSDYYQMVRTDTAEVVQGSKFKLTYTAANMGTDYTATAYFDFNKDGIFETSVAFNNEANGIVEVEVPDTAAYGKTRMRVRLTDNALEEADDDVHGQTYDFQLFVVKPKDTTDAVSNATASRPAAAATPAYGLDGRQVKEQTHKGVFIKNGQKRIK